VAAREPPARPAAGGAGRGLLRAAAARAARDAGGGGLLRGGGRSPARLALVHRGRRHRRGPVRAARRRLREPGGAVLDAPRGPAAPRGRADREGAAGPGRRGGLHARQVLRARALRLRPDEAGAGAGGDPAPAGGVRGEDVDLRAHPQRDRDVRGVDAVRVAQGEAQPKASRADTGNEGGSPVEAAMTASAVTERQYQGQAHEHSRRLMTAWMQELARAESERRPTGALMISGNCVELLRACHILPMFPEVTALQNAIRKKSLPLILKAEQAGYSSDNCAYVKADIGLFLDGGMGPGRPMPFPTITVCNYVGCNVYVKWFEHLADVSGSTLFMLDVPFARTPEPSPADVQYVVAQLRELIALCESVTGHRFDIDELREILADAARAEEGYARCKHLCRHHPAPFDSYFDAINMMGPINVLRGTPEAAEFFDQAVTEFEGLVAQGLGPLREERFRTVVEGPPPYPFYKSFRNLFARWGAVAVASTYSTVGGIWEWGFRHDPRRPLES